VLRFRCRVDISSIPNAGKGLFADELIPKKSIIGFPDNIKQVYSREQLLQLPANSPELQTSVRWFQDCYTTDPDYSDTYYINHSFKPNCLWHLGFVFAQEDIPADVELTLDYRVLMDNDPEFGFLDATTGNMIYGFPWEEKMIVNSQQLLLLFRGRANDIELSERMQALATA
jgi:hypothetical protein